ncbi:MAG: hypothetical protein Q7T33_08875 [Dehalococcoidia bacterium]|nr:hypothetical protein [Dehalococcoidia bacterium]
MRALWAPAVLMMAALALAACGGGGDALSEEDVLRKAANAVRAEGMVFHAQGDDGSEVWIDAVNQHYRKRDGKTGLVSVGEGWKTTSYDPLSNQTKTEETQFGPEVTVRINDPSTLWFEPLGALSFAQGIRLVGRTKGDGEDVIAVETASPIVDASSRGTGSFLVGRVELDVNTYLVTAFERRVTVAQGQPTPTPDLEGNDPLKTVRIRYETELVPADSLAADIFSTEVVEAQAVTLSENIQRVRDLKLTPYWLGEVYRNALGSFRLPDSPEAVVVDPEKRQAAFQYAMEVQATADSPFFLADEAIVVRLGPAGDTIFDLPTVQGFAGQIPEDQEVVEVLGQRTVVYTSILTPSDLPCPAGAQCVATSVPLYHRLLLTLADTAIQVETFAKVGSQGQESNQYNTKDGILALAQALTAAQ